MLEKLKSSLFGTLGCLVFVLVIGIAIVYLWLGRLGIEHHLGWWWAFGAILLAIGFRIVLPITIGVYFGVVDVIGWPWWAGLLIAAPGFILSFVPTLVLTIVDFARGRL